MESAAQRAYGPVIEVGHRAIGMLPEVVAAFLLLAALYLLGRGIGALTTRAAARMGRHRNLGIVLGRLMHFTVLIAGLLLSATVVFPSVSPGDLLQLLGVGSVAIGFAFRDILQNFLAGLLLLVTQPFRVGDQIVFDTAEGTVEDIQTRATVIRTYDNRRIVVPNASLFTHAVTVNTAADKRRMEHDVGIGVSEDIEHARRVITETLASLPNVLSEPKPEVLVVDLGDWAVKLKVRWWFSPPRRADVFITRDEVLTAIATQLTAAGIDLPFPTHKVLLQNSTAAAAGQHRDRAGWPPAQGAPDVGRA